VKGACCADVEVLTLPQWNIKANWRELCMNLVARVCWWCLKVPEVLRAGEVWVGALDRTNGLRSSLPVFWLEVCWWCLKVPEVLRAGEVWVGALDRTNGLRSSLPVFWLEVCWWCVKVPQVLRAEEVWVGALDRTNGLCSSLPMFWFKVCWWCVKVPQVLRAGMDLVSVVEQRIKWWISHAGLARTVY